MQSKDWGGKQYVLYNRLCIARVGRIKLAADGERLVGLWLEGQKYFAGTVKEEMTEAPGTWDF